MIRRDCYLVFRNWELYQFVTSRKLLPQKIRGERCEMGYSAEIHNQQARLGHLLNGITQTLASYTRILHPSVGHVVDTKRGHVSGDDRAHLEFFKGLKDARRVAREDACL